MILDKLWKNNKIKLLYNKTLIKIKVIWCLIPGLECPEKKDNNINKIFENKILIDSFKLFKI